MLDAELVDRSLKKALATGATEAYETIRREAMSAALKSGDGDEVVRIAEQYPKLRDGGLKNVGHAG